MDAIHGHLGLLKNAKILHRDISLNNIIIAYEQKYHYGFLIQSNLYTSIASGPGGAMLLKRLCVYRGLAVDLDLGDNVAACGAPERTGTYEFLSINALKLLDLTFHHCYYNDLYGSFCTCATVTQEQNYASMVRAGTVSVSNQMLAGHCSRYMFEDLLSEMRGVRVRRGRG